MSAIGSPVTFIDLRNLPAPGNVTDVPSSIVGSAINYGKRQASAVLSAAAENAVLPQPISRRAFASDDNTARIKDQTYDDRYKISVAVKKWTKDKDSKAALGSDTSIIESYIQGDRIRYNIDSQWQSLDPLRGVGLLASATQAISGKTLNNKLFSRRYWVGTSPIRIQLTMKFVAVDNAEEDVLKPIMLLQSAIMPGQDSLGFLKPPGPNPYHTSAGARVIKMLANSIGAGDLIYYDMGYQISLWIGNYIVLPSVIISDLSPSMGNTFDAKGIPMMAECDIVFETFQMYTKEDIKSAYTMALSPVILS